MCDVEVLEHLLYPLYTSLLGNSPDIELFWCRAGGVSLGDFAVTGCTG